LVASSTRPSKVFTRFDDAVTSVDVCARLLVTWLNGPTCRRAKSAS